MAQILSKSDAIEYDEDTLVTIYWDKKEYSKEDRDYVAAILKKKGYMPADKLKDVSNENLSEMIENAAGNTGTTALSKKLKVLFSYSFLCNEKKQREAAGEIGRLQEKNQKLQTEIRRLQAELQSLREPEKPEIIPLRKLKNPSKNRHTVTIDPNTHTKWSEFARDFPDKNILISLAMERLMQDVYTGKVTFTWAPTVPDLYKKKDGN